MDSLQSLALELLESSLKSQFSSRKLLRPFSPELGQQGRIDYAWLHSDDAAFSSPEACWILGQDAQKVRQLSDAIERMWSKSDSRPLEETCRDAKLARLLCFEYGREYAIRYMKKAAKMKFRDYQRSAIKAMQQHERGIVVMPCGAGKTVTACGAAYVQDMRTLVLVPTIDIKRQWEASAALWAFDDMLTAVCPAGISKVNLDEYEMLIVDECHHAAAATWRSVIDAKSWRRCYGLSATPDRPDDLAHDVYSLLGSIIYKITPQEVERQGHMLPGQVRIIPYHNRELAERIEAEMPLAAADNDFKRQRIMREVNTGYYDNPTREAIVARCIRHHIDQNDAVLCIVATKAAAQRIADAVGEQAKALDSTKSKSMRQALIKTFRAGLLPCIVATSLADEGLDCPRANVLIMAAGGRSKGRTQQRAGRVLRTFQDKEAGLIYDFKDLWHPFATAQSKARIKTYKELGYEVHEYKSVSE